MKLLWLKLKDKFWVNWIFFYSVLLIYFVSIFINFDFFKRVWVDFLNIFIKQIIPVLFIIYTLMFIFNILIKKEAIKEKIEKSSCLSKYFFVVVWWILSSWPVYMWYPFLKKLREHWLNHGHITTFIYARAVKIPFLVIMIAYFWLKYTIIFNLVIIFLSVLLWLLINLIFNFLSYEKNNS